MNTLFWSIVFCFLMLCAIGLEMLTSSMGGFSFAALVLGAVSVCLGFRASDAAGFVMLAVNVALFPLGLWLCIHFLKRSPLMHRWDATSGSQSSPDARPLAHFIGQEGRALTPLRPAGAAMIGEQNVDVVTEGKFVEAQTRIKVIRVEGNRVIVEAIT